MKTFERLRWFGHKLRRDTVVDECDVQRILEMMLLDRKRQLLGLLFVITAKNLKLFLI